MRSPYWQDAVPKYMDLTDTNPMNVTTKSNRVIGINNFVGCASRTNGVMPLPYHNGNVFYIKLVNPDTYAAYFGSATVRLWYV